jgi:hypothetical protein
VQRCVGCGGALPRLRAGDTTVTCQFCGLTAERVQPPPVVVRWDLVTSVRQLGRGAKLAVVVGLVAAAGVVAFSILRAVRPITEALDSVRQQSDEIRESLRMIAPSELAGIEPGRPRAVDIAGLADGLAALDPIGRLDWVLGIARAWSPDAVLERIEGGPIARDGTANLAADGDALLSYDFVSPQRLADWDREADVRRDAATNYRLELSLAKGGVTARIVRGRPRNVKVPPIEALLAVGDLLARARKNGFPDRAFYVGTLRYLPRVGWHWQLQTPSQREVFPRLRATSTGP